MHRLRFITVAASLLVAGAALAHDQNARDARRAGTAVDAGTGKPITIMYNPRHFSDAAWQGILKGDFNRMLPGLASLSTPVDLKIGEGTVPAGDYAQAGFQVNDKGEWYWTVKGTDGKELAKILLPVKESPDKAMHFTLTLLPGDAPNSFDLIYHYGNKVATVTFTSAGGAATKGEPEKGGR